MEVFGETFCSKNAHSYLLWLKKIMSAHKGLMCPSVKTEVVKFFLTNRKKYVYKVAI